MYVDFAVYGAGCGADPQSVHERADQTARFVQAFRDWRRKRWTPRRRRPGEPDRTHYVKAA